MARYFFDTRNGKTIRDDLGIECENTSDVRILALAGLADFAKEAIQADRWDHIAVHVRDEQNNSIMQISLRLDIEQSSICDWISSKAR